MNRPVHFEILADDPERAVKFYSAVFGWDFQKWEGPLEYWLITTGPDDAPGINGGMGRREQPVDGAGVIAYTCTMDVESVDDAVAKVKANGGSVISDKHAVPGVGWQAYFEDTEGNVFGVHQEDPNAQ